MQGGEGMSEIKALEKLRNLDGCIDIPMLKIKLCANTNTRNVIDALEAIADEIESEIAERFMELPVDADGVPIHMGDSVEGELLFDSATVKGTVCAYHIHDDDEPGTVYIRVKPTENTWTIKELRFKRCRHVKPRTLEDVLWSFADKWNSFAPEDFDGVYPSEVIDEFADEIRAMFGEVNHD